MTLLTTVRKRRTMHWYRSHCLACARREATNKNTTRQNLQPLMTVPFMTSTANNTSSVCLNGENITNPPLTTNDRLLQKDFHTYTRKQDTNNSNENEVEHNPPLSGWKASLVTFLNLLNIDPSVPVKKAKGIDINSPSTPVPCSSSVAYSQNSEVFWRYDADTYAANYENEDRSQYFVDNILLAPSESEKEIETSIFFCGCYDGHGGNLAVDYVQKNLYPNFRAALLKQGSSTTKSVRSAILKAFEQTDSNYLQKSQQRFRQGRWQACAVGACALIAVVVDQTLFIANCGDCRAVLATRNIKTGELVVEQITSDHSANEQRERERLRALHPDDYDIIREVGIENFYIKGRLQPTRSIGDTYMKVKHVNRSPMPPKLRVHGGFDQPYVSAVPDLFEINLKSQHPEFLVLGSDGLYGEMDNEKIATLVDTFRQNKLPNASLALRKKVLDKIANEYHVKAKELEKVELGDRRDYHDDITINVLHFLPPPIENEVDNYAQAA